VAAVARLPTATRAMKLIAIALLGGCQLAFPLDNLGRCPDSYEELSIGDGTSGCYRFVIGRDNQLAWRDAEIEGKKDGPNGHLAVLGWGESPTAEENVLFEHARLIEDFPNNPDTVADLFIGMSARLGDYRWVTDEPVEVPPNDTPPWAP